MVIAADFREEFLYGVVSVTQLTGSYNSIPLHSRPLAQNYISNTLLNHLQVEAGVDETFRISTSTHPLPEPKTVSKS